MNETKSKKRIIIWITVLALIVVAVVTGVVIHRNSYGTSIKADDFEYSYAEQGGYLVVTVTPKVNIKDFKFRVIIFGPTILHQAGEFCEIEFTPKDKALIYKFNLEELKRQLNGWDWEKVDIGDIRGKKQNKYK